MEILGYIASFAMGIILGLLGGGGAILTVPILVYLFQLSPVLATGHSLFIVGLTALIGSFMYIRKGDFHFKVGLIFAVPSALGVNVSRGLILPQIPEIVARIGGFELTKEILIMVTFAGLMMAASLSMIKKRKERKPSAGPTGLRLALIGAEGFMIGLLAGFVGAGGGFMIIPALVLLAGLPMRAAVGTSLMIIALQSLLGFAGDVSRGTLVHWSLLGMITGIAALGIIAGSALSHKIHEQKLKVAFGWLALLMGISILIEQSRHLS